MRRGEFLKSVGLGLGVIATLPAGVIGLARATPENRLALLLDRWNDGIVDARILWPHNAPFFDMVRRAKPVPPGDPAFKFFRERSPWPSDSGAWEKKINDEPGRF